MITKNNSTLDLKRIRKQDQKDGRKCIFAILKAKLKTKNFGGLGSHLQLSLVTESGDFGGLQVHILALLATKNAEQGRKLSFLHRSKFYLSR